MPERDWENLMDTQMERLEQLKKEHEPWLRDLPGFRGVGIGVSKEQSLCLKVLVAQMPNAVLRQIAERLSEADVEIEDTGDFQAY